MKYNGKEIVKVDSQRAWWDSTCTGCVFRGEDDCNMYKAKEYMQYTEVERDCELDAEGKPAHVIFMYVGQ